MRKEQVDMTQIYLETAYCDHFKQPLTAGYTLYVQYLTAAANMFQTVKLHMEY